MQYLEASLKESVDDIFTIGRECFENFYPRDKFLKKIEDRKVWVYIAKEKQEVVGFKILYEDDTGALYSWLGAVKIEYRRRGIASKLMDMAIGFAKEDNYSKVKLKTHKGHPEMLALCGKYGFVEVDRDPNHWGDGKEAIFLELDF